MSRPEAVFLDSNIPMYAAGREHAYRVPCQQLLQRIVRGELEALTSTEVHQEILHRYLALGQPAQARELSARFHRIVPDVLPVIVEDIVRARELLLAYPNLPARDLIHVAVMLNNGVTAIVSADRHFDQVGEIRRIDPLSVEGRR